MIGHRFTMFSINGISTQRCRHPSQSRGFPSKRCTTSKCYNNHSHNLCAWSILEKALKDTDILLVDGAAVSSNNALNWLSRRWDVLFTRWRGSIRTSARGTPTHETSGSNEIYTDRQKFYQILRYPTRAIKNWCATMHPCTPRWPTICIVPLFHTLCSSNTNKCTQLKRDNQKRQKL
jgi:hypothetical protein